MKRIASITLVVFLLTGSVAKAGYDPNFRQLDNMLRLFNPAFSGLDRFDSRSLLLNFRNQWMNLSNGNPLTFSGTWGGYFEKLKGAADISYLYDKIGSTKNNWFSFKYSYRLRMGEKSLLGFGARASFAMLSHDFGACTTGTCDISGIKKDIIVPDLDLGLMFNAGENFFVSLSARHLTEPDAKVKGASGTEYTLQQELLTYYGVLGGHFEAGEHFQVTVAADYKRVGSTDFGEARAEARWRFIKAGFYCQFTEWNSSLNPYGFTFGFSPDKGRVHILSSFEPEYKNSGGANLEAGLRYVFGKKD